MKHLDHELTDNYLNGKLSSQAQKQLQEHLESCAECEALVKRWDVFRGVILERQQPKHSSAFVGEVMDRISPQPPEPSRVGFFDFMHSWGVQMFASVTSLVLIFNLSMTSPTVASTSLVTASFEGEIMSYGYSEDTFRLSKVLALPTQED